MSAMALGEGARHDVVRTLFLAPDPANLGRMQQGMEQRHILDALERGECGARFVVKSVPAVSLQDMTREIKRFHPHIIHFSGHGSQEGDLYFVTAMGVGEKINPNNLEGIFRRLRGEVECVFLNACYSAIRAGTIAKHIPFVIGFQGVIQEEAAHFFALGFYQGLAHCESFPRAFESGCDLARGKGFHIEAVLMLGPERAAAPPQPPSGVVASGLIALSLLSVVLFVKGSTANNGKARAAAPDELLPSVVVSDSIGEPSYGVAAAPGHAAMTIGGAALLRDGSVEVSGEVRLVERMPAAVAEQFLRSLAVEVTLDGAVTVAAIDVGRARWTAVVAPAAAVETGKQLPLRAVLRDRQGEVLDQVDTSIFVETAEQSS